MDKIKVEYMPTEKLKPYENNAKLHPREQIEQIKKSISQFGFNDPIAVWEGGEIIEGHGRLQAAKELGLTEVPVVLLENLTDEERRAYMIVHNKLTMNTSFDFAVLEEELENLTIDMSDFGIDSYDIDWDNIPELSNREYDKPQHNMLECPKCHHIDRDIHFKKVKGVEAEEQNTSD